MDNELGEIHRKLELARDLQALLSNKEFKKIISTGFFTDYCLQAAYNSVNVALTDRRGVENPHDIMFAVGVLKAYLYGISTDGEHAKEALEEFHANDKKE